MATIITKKRRTLVLPKKTGDQADAQPSTKKAKAEAKKQPQLKVKAEPEKKELTGEERNNRHNAKQAKERNKRLAKAKQWLLSSWPELFDPKNVRPLGLTVGKSVQAAYSNDKREKGELGFGWIHVSTNIARWIRSKKYTEIMQTAVHRYNLDGSQAEEIQDHERAPRQWENAVRQKEKQS